MKNSFLVFLLCFGFVACQAQNKAVSKASNLLEAEKLAEAKEQIDMAVEHEKTKDKPKTWFTKGQVYGAIALSEDESVRSLVADPLEEATSAYRKAMELEGKETDPYYQFSSQGIDALWGEMRNKAAEEYNAGNFETALEYFDNALKVKPEDTDAALYAGGASQQIGDLDKASEYFYMVEEADSADLPIYNFLMAYELEQNEDYEKATEVLKKAQEKYPDDVELKKQEVNLLLKQEKTAEAKEQLQKAIEAEPDNALLHFNLGYLNEELGDQEAAIKAYENALKADPNHQNSAYNLAVIYYNRGYNIIKEANDLGISAADRKKEKELYEQADQKFTEAIPYLEQALKLNPENEQLMQITMIAYERSGDEAKAQELEKKLESMPSSGNTPSEN